MNLLMKCGIAKKCIKFVYVSYEYKSELDKRYDCLSPVTKEGILPPGTKLNLYKGGQIGEQPYWIADENSSFRYDNDEYWVKEYVEITPPPKQKWFYYN